MGMGCLAGPVVVCAVLFARKFFKKRHKKLYWLRDSKLLLSHQRETYFKNLIREKNFRFQISLCYPKIIDKLNIYQAARFAMRKAVRKLKIKNGVKTIVLVDGKTEIKNLNLPQMAIVKGDRKVFAIACASIIAKVYRDRMMKNYGRKFPQYGFEKHMGYPTRFHKEELLQHGPCPIHRKSFAPVANCVKIEK